MKQQAKAVGAPNVTFWRSIRTRLSGILVVFSFFTVSFISWTNATAFEKFLSHQIEDSLVQHARFTGDGVGAYFKYLTAQISTMARRLQTEPAKRYPALMSALVTSDPDFRAVMLAEVGPGKTVKTVSAVAPVDNQPELWQALATAVKGMGKQRQAFVDLESTLGRADAAMILRFNQGKGQPQLAMALVFKKARLFSGVLTSGGVLLQLVDAKGGIVLSSRTVPTRAKRSPAALVNIARGSDSPYGFRRGYLNDQQHAMIGAFAQLKDVGVVVTAERDAALAAREISVIAQRTLLWGLLIITVAAAAAYLLSGRMTVGMMTVIDATRRLAAGELDTTVPSNRTDELGLLAHAVNDMGGQIKRLLTDQLESARLARELDTAKIVQSSFFPSDEQVHPISAKDVMVCGSYIPASECGGDWWGSYRLGDHYRLICVADAMGHGVPAALVTAMAYAGFTLVADDAPTESPSAVAFLQKFNRIIYHALKGATSMTCFIAIIDIRDGSMRYANAGHCFPFIMPGDPDDARWRKDAVTGALRPTTIKLPGTPLGYERDPTFEERTMQLLPGDRLVFYSDGLTEARAQGSDKMWGPRGITQAMTESATMDAAGIHAGILAAAKAYYGSRPPDDDITLVVVEMPKRQTAGKAA